MKNIFNFLSRFYLIFILFFIPGTIGLVMSFREFGFRQWEGISMSLPFILFGLLFMRWSYGVEDAFKDHDKNGCSHGRWDGVGDGICDICNKRYGE